MATLWTLSLSLSLSLSLVSDSVETQDVAKLVGQTVLRGRNYNLPGISEEVIRAWIKEFERMDSAESALALEASIDQEDIAVVFPSFFCDFQ